ncbi:DUF3106 domain-containing protein [Noviherbaspirillum pedocola]|uniref:DUF3106 domain-containing protein n=1 Tax=Noviherbaspirillum pedocola TaxID=2801341 RepID=A0A934SR94_9BURK|nr:DUF3106 domain-containing protein [Noviherbaspirillum pedocola]MBK4734092.1 DUF3106 domain-containing protein [Noviherbaspirillum pedocola]
MPVSRRCVSLACCTLLLTAALGASANSIGPQGTPTPRPAAAATTGPAWKDLSLVQKEVLKPLEPEWNGMPGARKRKWLTMAHRYAELSPEQQARMQERMGAWATLTPEQRRIARENYARARKLQPDQKSAEWQQYQQLSEEEKKHFAEQTRARKGVASLPPPAFQDRAKLVPPPKSVLKKELQPVPAPSSPPAVRAPVPAPTQPAQQSSMPPTAQPQPAPSAAN